MATVPKNLETLADEDAFSSWLLRDSSSLHILLLFTEWDALSKPGSPMDIVFTSLAERHAALSWAKVRKCV